MVFDRSPGKTAWQLFTNRLDAWTTESLGGWRAREKLASHLPEFLRIFPTPEQNISVLEMFRGALLDPFAAVRDAATYGVPASYEILIDQPTSSNFHQILLELGTSGSYKHRKTFVRCLRQFVRPPPNRTAFEDFFLPALPRITADVVDVRLALAQVIADLFVLGAYYGVHLDPKHAETSVDPAKAIPSAIRDLARALADDEAVDVRETVRHVNLSQVHGDEDRQVPYEVPSPERPERGTRSIEAAQKENEHSAQAPGSGVANASTVAQQEKPTLHVLKLNEEALETGSAGSEQGNPFAEEFATVETHT